MSTADQHDIKHQIQFQLQFHSVLFASDVWPVSCHGQNLQSKMRDFEARARPLRDWMRATEVRVQQSTVAASLHDVQSKRQQLNKLQVHHIGTQRHIHPHPLTYASTKKTCASVISDNLDPSGDLCVWLPFNPCVSWHFDASVYLMTFQWPLWVSWPCDPCMLHYFITFQ